MFSGVLGQNLPHRRMGVGAMVSVVLHAGVVAGVVWMTARPVVQDADVPDPVYLVPPRGGGGGPQVQLQDPRPKTQPTPPRKRPDLTVPRTVPTQVAPAPVEPPDDASETLQGVPSAGSTVAFAGLPGVGTGSGPGGPGDGTGVPEMDCGEEHNPCQYVPQMEKPVLLSGARPQYTRDAALAGVEGTLVLSCVIDTDGSVDGCRTLKGLPHMEEEVRRALATQRYRPFRVNGQPVAVRYVFNFTFRFRH